MDEDDDQMQLMEVRQDALEKLLMHYMNRDRPLSGNHMVVSLSPENAAKVEFTFPPIKTEIDTLCDYLRLLKKNSHEGGHRRLTVETLNEMLKEAGLKLTTKPISEETSK